MGIFIFRDIELKVFKGDKVSLFYTIRSKVLSHHGYSKKKKKKRKVMNKNCVLLKEKIKQKRYTSKEERKEERNP